MNRKTLMLMAGAVALTGGLALAQANMSGMDHEAMDHGEAGKADLAGNAAVQGYAAAMDRMMADTPPYTGDADVDFVKGMIPHHQAAIDMARIQLAHGKDPGIRALAQEVIDTQEAEIAEMRAWLLARGE